MEIKQKILETLSSEWKSTNRIAKDSGVNWYRTERLLYELLSQRPKIIEMDDKPDAKYWRVKE